MDQTATPLSEIVPSLIRTYVPSIVGALVTWLLTLGVELDDSASTALIAFGTALLTAIYYTLVRLAETKKPGIGALLLGSSRSPVSTKPNDVYQVTAAKRAIEKNEAF